MSFADAQARLQQAVFGRLGEDATWSGVDGVVRVRHREADEEIGFARGSSLVTGERLKVRRSEVPAPAQGDEVQLLDSDGNPVADGAYVVTSEPVIDRNGVWTCDVTPA